MFTLYAEDNELIRSPGNDADQQEGARQYSGISIRYGKPNKK